MESSELLSVRISREWSEQLKFTMDENQQQRPSKQTRPIRAAKAKDIEKYLKCQIESEEWRETWLEDEQHQISEHIK